MGAITGLPMAANCVAVSAGSGGSFEIVRQRWAGPLDELASLLGGVVGVAGCAGAKHIIAINTDPAAPMMARADYAVVGDLHAVIPALVEALRDRPSRAG